MIDIYIRSVNISAVKNALPSFCIDRQGEIIMAGDWGAIDIIGGMESRTGRDNREHVNLRLFDDDFDVSSIPDGLRVSPETPSRLWL